MARPWEQLSAPFERADDRAARHLLREHWGLTAETVERLDSERDDTFHIATPDGEYTLKLSHPGDDPHVIGMQSAAMLHAAAAGLPVPQVYPTVDGGTHPLHGDRVVWVLTWLSGDLLLLTTDGPEADELGRTLGGLNKALANFEHPAAHRTFAWDLGAAAELEELLDLVPRDAVREALLGVPDLSGLPQQVIHGDFHPGNILVRDGKVVGILDFGDVLYTARVADLAIALSYLPQELHDSFIAGFESVVPLTADERAVLGPCIRARTAQRILLGAHAGHDVGGLADRLEAG
jgi:Ser/Thr protein kinase RdoA (MazF antagonist)